VVNWPCFRKDVALVAFLLLVVLAWFTAGASAQSFKATVIGTVLDPSGAVVPGATVTIVQQGTGLAVIGTSSADGCRDIHVDGERSAGVAARVEGTVLIS
jgi:hypothetical protein